MLVTTVTHTFSHSCCHGSIYQVLENHYILNTQKWKLCLFGGYCFGNLNKVLTTNKISACSKLYLEHKEMQCKLGYCITVVTDLDYNLFFISKASFLQVWIPSYQSQRVSVKTLCLCFWSDRPLFIDLSLCIFFFVNSDLGIWRDMKGW